MLTIKNNLMADNAARHLGSSYASLSKSVERLSSGLRINSSKDDAAGLAVRELMRADVAQLRQASRNAQDAVSMLQTAEGAMAVMDNILVRMKELAEQASTGSYSDEQRGIMSSEYTQLATELTRIADSTTFNGISLLNGDANYATVSFHLGAGNNSTISFTTDDMRAAQIANNGSLLQSGATKTTALYNRTVASASDNYLEVGEITAGTGDILSFDFTGANANTDFTVDVGAYAATGISLNKLVEEINAAANGEALATAVWNDTMQGYQLKVEADNAGADNALDVATAGTVAVMEGAGKVTITGGVAAGNIDLTDITKAPDVINQVTLAIKTKDEYRAQLGYYMNRLESAVSILDIQAENLSTAESRISDVDVATEMAAMTRNQVLAQAGISMLAQANQMPQMAMKLLG